MSVKVRTCVECQGVMSPIIIMDVAPSLSRRAVAETLSYRMPDDRVSFWTGKYPTAGVVQAYLCAGCDRIALYGQSPDSKQTASVDDGSQQVRE